MLTIIKRFVQWEGNNEVPAQWWALISFRSKLKRILVGLHPHIAIRYAPVISYLDSKIDSSGPVSVLEVGSGSLGITRFWHHPVTGLDVSFDGAELGYLKQVSGSATQLPFDDREFQCVISIDMLEHLSKADRVRAISEMIRVAGEVVIIALPSDYRALKAENKALFRYQNRIRSCRNKARKRVLIKRSAFLQEHRDCSLPDEGEVLSAIGKSLSQTQRDADIRTLGNESIWVWHFLLPSVIPCNRPKAVLIKIAGLLLLPLIKRVGWGGFYRKFFFINLNQGYRGDL